jgi:hypothetical protein
MVEEVLEIHLEAALQQGDSTCCLRFHFVGTVADGRHWVFLPHPVLQSQVQALAATLPPISGMFWFWLCIVIRGGHPTQNTMSCGHLCQYERAWEGVNIGTAV